MIDLRKLQFIFKRTLTNISYVKFDILDEVKPVEKAKILDFRIFPEL